MVIMAWVSGVYKTIWSEEVTRGQKKEMITQKTRQE